MANWIGTSKNDTKKGTAQADRLEGLAGNDILDGHNGDDVLIGGVGADVLTGGRGRDTYVYNAAADSGVAAGTSDVITDFNAQEGDRIDLSALGQITWGGEQAIGSGTASVWYAANGTGASLFVDVDGNGTADMRIDLTGVASISQSDLVGVSMPTVPPSQPEDATPPQPPAPPSTPEDTTSSPKVDVPSSSFAKPDTASIAEDATLSSVSGNVLLNDASGFTLTTVSGQQLSTGKNKALAIQGEHGTLTIGRDGNWTYTLNNQDAAVQALGLGETKTETFTYVTTSKKGETATSTLTVTITGTNDAPVATISGNQTFDEDQPVSFAVPAFTDVDGDALSYTATLADGEVLPSWLVFDAATRGFSGTPPADFQGALEITVTGSDGTLSASNTFALTIAGTNDAPVAADGAAQGDEDGGAITGSVAASDADGDALTYSLVEGPAAEQGTLVFGTDGTYSFVPAKDFNGDVTFTYKASDSTANSNTATVTISVTPVDEELPVVSLGDATVSEAVGAIEIPVTLSHASDQDVTLTYEVFSPGKTITFDGTTEGKLPSGYEGVRWTNILAHGDGSAIVATAGGQFQALDTNGFTLTGLTLSTDYLNQLGGQQTVTFEAIKDGHVVGTKVVVLTNGAASVPVEFDPASFSGIDTVRIDGASHSSGSTSYDAPVRIDNVVLAGSQPATGMVTIPAGQTTGSITIPVVNDSVYEVGEKVVVKLSGAEGATLGDEVEAVGSITNDDPEPLPMISIENFVEGRVEEGGLGLWFELTRDSRLDEELTVQFESEVFGDFEVTFEAGSDRVRFIELGLEDDDVDLGTRDYEIRIKESPNYIPSGKTSLTGTAVDNDGNSPPEAYDLNFTIDEDTLADEGLLFSGQGYDNQQWSLSYEIVEQPIAWGTVELSDVDYGSGPLFKFTPHDGALEHLNDGQTQDITFQYVANDGAGGISAPATVTLKVSGVSDDYVAPTISVGDVAVTEGSGQWAIVKITLSGPSVRDIAVNYEMTGGTAAPFQDYSPAMGTARIPAGQTEVEIAIPIREDTNVEGEEHFNFVLSNPVNATILDGTSTVTIIDNEQGGGMEPTPNLPTISVTDVSMSEGGNLNFRFPMSAASDERLTVAYEIVFGTATADDISFSQTGTFLIAAGQANRGLNVLTVEDLLPEGDETFTFRITSVSTNSGAPGAIIVDAEATGTILNDDGPPIEEPLPGDEEPAGAPGVNVSNLNLNLSEDGATDTTEVWLNSKPTSDVTITLGSDGGVLFSVGGAAPSATPTLTFTPENWNQRQTVTVTAIDDAEYEPGGGTTLYFEPISTQDPLYQDVYPPSGWATIADNEAAPEVAAPEAQPMSADVWEDNPVAELQGNGYSAGEFGIVEYMIVSQPVEGGTVTMTDDRTFRFEGDTEFLSSLNRGETAAITFQYAVSDGEVWSEPGTMTFNVHGFTNGADETYQAFTRSTSSQVDFLDLNGGDGNDTVVFNSITVTSGEDVSVGLDQAFHWTEYAGKSIINTENITIRDTTGDTARTMTVSGNDQVNVITIENTDHKLSILGRGGDDTINFNGTGNGLTSVINGGAGNDTINAHSAVIVNVAEGNDTVNVFNGSNVTVQNFTQGDRINFAAGIEAGNVSAAVQGTNTVFTVNQDGVTSTVTVTGATNLVAGTDWTAGVAAEPLPVEPAVITAQSDLAEVTEGGIATFTFTRTGDLSQALTVPVTTTSSTAVAGQDFTAPSTITFAQGSDTATLEVQTLTDAVAESPATIEVRLVEGAGYTVATTDGVVTSLVDAQDAEPTEPVLPSLSINDVEVSENAGTASFTVTLSAAAAAAVSVEYATTPASGPVGTFQPASGTLTFAPGETTKTIAVALNDNTTVATGAQTFVVTLSNASGATLADLSGEGTILDDDMPVEMPALVIETTAALDEFSTISWNAIPGAASYVLIGIEPDEPNFAPHTLGFAVAPNTSLAINGNDEFVGMVVTVEARDGDGNVLARSENQTDLIANVNDVPTGRPLISDNTPEVGQLLTISIGDLEDGDGMRADRPDEFSYIWERSTDGVTWSRLPSTATEDTFGDFYQVTAADAGYFIRGGAQYADRGETLETVYSLTTAAVNDPNPDTPPVAFDDAATTSAGEAVTIDVLFNDFDFEDDLRSIETFGQPANGSVTLQDGKLVYTPNANFVGTDTFEYTLNGGDTAKVTVTVEQADAAPLTLLTVDALDENSTLSWTAFPGAVSYVLIGTEPDDPTAPPHELGFALAPATSFDINGDDEFAGMAIHVEARDANGVVLTRSVNETGLITNINDIPTGNLGLDDMTPEVGQVLTLDYGTFEDGDGYRDRGREEEFQWAFERSLDGVTWTTIVTGASAGEDGPFGFSYTVTQADDGHFLRGRAIYEDRAGDTIETVYSLSTGRVGATVPGESDGDGGGGGDTGGEFIQGSLIITQTDGSTEVTEGGAGDTFTVALADEPTSDVLVDMFSSNNHSWAFGPDGSMTLLFTPDNWDAPQTVTVMADDDFVREPTELDGQYLYTTSSDPRYDGLMPELPVTVYDGPGEPDPTPYVSVGVDGNGVVTEGGEIVFNFMRREGVNTNPLEIVVKMEGLDPGDIEMILWNGVEDGVKGFQAGSATATMTVVLADNAIVESDRFLDLTVLATEAYFDDFDNFASALVLDNDVAGEEPVNQAPVAGDVTIELFEDNVFTEITPDVTDPDDDPTTITPFGELPLGVTFDEASQRFVFNGDPADFDALNTGDMATVSFQYVAKDSSGDSDLGTITININGITNPAAPQIDPEPAQYADPYNYDQGNSGPAGQRTSGDDILNDGAGLSSTINGFGGNDTIYGRDLNDLLTGGRGNDLIHGGSGDDDLRGDAGGTDTRNVGESGSDTLYGGDGNDVINGHEGNDIIIGGHGSDNLVGAEGDDTFVFFDIFDRGDTITMQGQLAANDVFDFRNFDFGPNELGTQGPANGLQFLNEAPVEGQMLEDVFYYDKSSGRLSLNTGTDRLEDFNVTLLMGDRSPLPQINADDFLN